MRAVSKKGSFYRSTPKREPFSRLWFLSRGYKQADPRYTNGQIVWLHPETNDVLNQYGQKRALQLVPGERYKKTKARYLKLPIQCGNMLLARLKYLTFIGDIPKGCVIDHIDGNPLNNNIRNLRAVTRAINDRDGGFLRKLRNKGIRPDLFSGALPGYFERMAVFRETHTEREYEQLTRDEIMSILVGSRFTIVRSSIVDDFPEL